MGRLEALTRINDICFFVPDMEKAVDFYCSKMNFKIKLQRENLYTIFDFCGTGLTLWQENEVAEYAIDSQYFGEKGGRFMIAIKVPLSEDVDHIASELIKNGVECISPPKNYHWNCRAVYFRDVFGYIWEVFAWLGEKEESSDNDRTDGSKCN